MTATAGAVAARGIYEAVVRNRLDYRDQARNLEIDELKEEIDSMHAGFMIGDEDPHDEDAVILDYFRPRRHQRKKHFSEIYKEIKLPLDAEMYDDLLRE